MGSFSGLGIKHEQSVDPKALGLTLFVAHQCTRASHPHSPLPARACRPPCKAMVAPRLTVPGSWSPRWLCRDPWGSKQRSKMLKAKFYKEKGFLLDQLLPLAKVARLQGTQNLQVCAAVERCHRYINDKNSVLLKTLGLRLESCCYRGNIPREQNGFWGSIEEPSQKRFWLWSFGIVKTIITSFAVIETKVEVHRQDTDLPPTAALEMSQKYL